MANGLHFAYLGKTFDGRAHVRRPERFRRVDRRYVEFGKLVGLLAGRAPLENQRFVLRDVPA